MRQGGGSQYDMVSASGDASLRLIYGGDVQPVNPKLIPDYKNFIPAAEVAAAQHDRRQALRDLAAVGPEHAALQHEGGHAGADELGLDLRREVQGQDHGPGQPDPDRRRRAVPVEEGAEPRYHGPVRAERRSSSTRRSNLLKQQRPLIKKYWALAVRRDRPVQERRRRRSAPRGRTRRTRSQAAKAPVKDLIPTEGATGLGGHVDAVGEGEAPELRVPVDEVGLDAEGAGAAGDLLRRDAGEHEGLRGDGQAAEGLVCAVPRRCAGVVLRLDQVLEDAGRRTAATARRTAWTTRSGSRPGRRSRASGFKAYAAGRPQGSARRRFSAAFWRRPWLRGTLLLLPPLAWFVLIYLAALVVAVHLGVLERRRRSRARSSTLEPRQLPDDLRRPDVPRRSRCGRSGWPPR